MVFKKGDSSPKTEEWKRKIGDANRGRSTWSKGKHLSDEHRRNISISHKGLPSTMKGKHHSEETKQKIQKSVGFGTDHANWKGGKVLRERRSRAKRRCLGHEMLNEPFEGCEGHHIDRDHIVFIPKWLHQSIHHNINKPDTMRQINMCMIYWLMAKRSEK